VTAAAVPLPRALSATRIADALLLATFFCVTFEKVHWNVAGTVRIADVLTILFLIAFALSTRGASPRTTATLLGFFAAFLAVYLLGFFNIQFARTPVEWLG
jgi:Zn-dependent protease with chaperone function